MNQTHLEVATTIQQQLGGRMFAMMTGAKHFAAHTDERGALSFKLPSNFATRGINYVKVTLTAADDYTVEFGKVRGLKYQVLDRFEGIYAEQLRELFTRTTGLDTSMGRIIMAGGR